MYVADYRNDFMHVNWTGVVIDEPSFDEPVLKSLLFVLVPAHCLHTVTEDNPELLCSLNTAVLGVLENVLLSSQPAMAHTLLRTLAAGTLCHFFLGKLPKTGTC